MLVTLDSKCRIYKVGQIHLLIPDFYSSYWVRITIDNSGFCLKLKPIHSWINFDRYNLTDKDDPSPNRICNLWKNENQDEYKTKIETRYL